MTKIRTETLLLIASEFVVAAVGGYGMRQAANRANQWGERGVAALEEIAHALNPPQTTTMGVLCDAINKVGGVTCHLEDARKKSHAISPLHRVSIKPIPAPDPEPCVQTAFGPTAADAQWDCHAAAYITPADCRDDHGVHQVCQPEAYRIMAV